MLSYITKWITWKHPKTGFGHKIFSHYILCWLTKGQKHAKIYSSFIEYLYEYQNPVSSLAFVLVPAWNLICYLSIKSTFISRKGRHWPIYLSWMLGNSSLSACYTTCMQPEQPCPGSCQVTKQSLGRWPNPPRLPSPQMTALLTF